MITEYCQAQAYSRPPWPFRGAEQIAYVMDTDPGEWPGLLPPTVELDPTPEGLARCEVRVCWYPWSAFGPFHETYIIVRCRHADRTVWFLPLIMTDNDIPLSAGREAWGYAKKLAVMEWRWNAHTAGQVLFTMDRPAGQRLMTTTFRATRQADPAERHGHPVMSWRHLPGSAGTLSELVVLGGSKALRSDAAGRPVLWAGEGSVDLSGVSPLDPWHLARPVEVLTAYWQTSDFALAPGHVVERLTPAQ